MDRQEDLYEIEESTLRSLPLSPSDLSIIFALRTKTQAPSSALKMSAWGKIYADVEIAERAATDDDADSVPGARGTHGCLLAPRGDPGQAGRPNVGGFVLGCIETNILERDIHFSV